MITNMHNLSPYSYNTVASYGAGSKLYVPVSPSSVIYAQFDHISGVAAKGGQRGVSITKIQILNALIDNLSKIKANAKLNPISKETYLSDEQVNNLIKNYQSQLKQTVASAQNTPYLLAGVKPQNGTLFTIDA